MVHKDQEPVEVFLRKGIVSCVIEIVVFSIVLDSFVVKMSCY